MSFESNKVSTTIITGPFVACTAASGGTLLGSGTAGYGVRITNVQAGISGAVFVGGIGPNAPFSGQGYYLDSNQTLVLPVTNFNQVRICAAISGVSISYIGLG